MFGVSYDPMELSNCYKTTYAIEYQRQPKWKQKAIDDDIKQNRSSGLTDDFIRNVISRAEDQFEQHLSDEKLKLVDVPKKKSRAKKKKIEEVSKTI